MFCVCASCVVLYVADLVLFAFWIVLLLSGVCVCLWVLTRWMLLCFVFEYKYMYVCFVACVFLRVDGFAGAVLLCVCLC